MEEIASWRSGARRAARTVRVRPPVRKDSADKFLEHVRTVHFSLVTTSFALFVTSLIRTEGFMERALDESRTSAHLMKANFTDRLLDKFSADNHSSSSSRP